jgi:hypothetical protein
VLTGSKTHPRARRWIGLWLAVACLAGALGAGSALALRGTEVVTITSSGFAPHVLRFDAADVVPSWQNNDSSAHVLTFSGSGKRCAVTIPAGGQVEGPCGSYSQCAKQLTYTVDAFPGTTGTVVITPESRAITLQASSRAIRKGAAVDLSGLVSYAQPSPPAPARPETVVVRRVSAPHPGGIVMQVESSGGFRSTWQARVHPASTTTYQVEVTAQPRAGCTLWAPAKSRRVTVVVH